jgi:hypothetical protein
LDVRDLVALDDRRRRAGKIQPAYPFLEVGVDVLVGPPDGIPEWATHIEASVVLPKPTGATIRVSAPSKPRRTCSCKEALATAAQRPGGTLNFVRISGSAMTQSTLQP